jgi:hypothetical protein
VPSLIDELSQPLWDSCLLVCDELEHDVTSCAPLDVRPCLVPEHGTTWNLSEGLGTVGSRDSPL